MNWNMQPLTTKAKVAKVRAELKTISHSRRKRIRYAIASMTVPLK